MIDTHVHLLDPARFPYPETSSGYVPSAGETGTLDDLLALLDVWGPWDGQCGPDLDFNGSVDVDDALLVLAGWK
mgnify:CR=1 FL=1